MCAFEPITCGHAEGLGRRSSRSERVWVSSFTSANQWQAVRSQSARSLEWSVLRVGGHSAAEGHMYLGATNAHPGSLFIHRLDCPAMAPPFDRLADTSHNHFQSLGS